MLIPLWYFLVENKFLFVLGSFTYGANILNA